jgi:hypothetical protein
MILPLCEKYKSMHFASHKELFCTCSDELVSVRWLRSFSSDEQVKMNYTVKMNKFCTCSDELVSVKNELYCLFAKTSFCHMAKMRSFSSDEHVIWKKCKSIHFASWDSQVGFSYLREKCAEAFTMPQKKNYFVLVLAFLVKFEAMGLHAVTSNHFTKEQVLIHHFAPIHREVMQMGCPKHTQVCSPFCPLENSVCVWNEDHGPNESNFIKPVLERANERCTWGGQTWHRRIPSLRGWDRSSAKRDHRSGKSAPDASCVSRRPAGNGETYMYRDYRAIKIWDLLENNIGSVWSSWNV